MGGVSCPAADTIVAFAEGLLTPDALASIESHAVTCAHCQDLLAAAVAAEGHRDIQDLAVIAGVGERSASITPGSAVQLLATGQQVGRYTILSRVGSGGMGEVYAAYDPKLDRRVAIKLLHRNASLAPDRAQARLMREAQSMARVSHSNVVAVHDVGWFEGRVYVAMDYVDGTTMTEWLGEPSRTREEILTIFVAAAQGLAAAHAAGLVHRDFKPANVMISVEGRVRVTDFGLARSMTNASAEATGDAGKQQEPKDYRLTQTGELLGTPLFMAPEQFAGARTDARTDQFGFCVALYRALYGVPPFSGDTVKSLMQNVLAGRVEPGPPNSTVPAQLRHTLLRGLAVDPAARWPTMAELVAALQHDRNRVRRRGGQFVGAIALVGILVLVLGRGTVSKAELCLGGPGRLADTWEDGDDAHRPRRSAVEKAFLASGARDAVDVWRRVAALLDRYRARWLGEYKEACEATNLRHEQPGSILDLRMSCLDERRRALSALTSVLVAADTDTVKNAVNAANALPDLDKCSDRQQLETPVEPPRDEATRRRVDDLRLRAAIAKATSDTGKHKEAASMLRDQITEARAIGYRPVLAELLVAFAWTHMNGTYTDEVPPLLEEAFHTALAVGRDDLAAQAVVGLVGGVGGVLGRFDEGHAWARMAEALIDRAGGGQELLRSWLLTNEAIIYHEQHQDARAFELSERSLAIKEKVLPPGHPDIAAALNNEANILAQLGRNDEALRSLNRARELWVRAYGPESVEAAMALSTIGECLNALSRSAEALEPLHQSLVIWEAQVGHVHPYLGYPLTALGHALDALGRSREALPPLERALRVREAGEHDPSPIAETRFALARALWDANADRTRARRLAHAARAAWAQVNDTKDVAAVDEWLARAKDARP